MSSGRSSDFLRFCVEQKLQGNAEGLKESTVGVEVFGRAPDYDPKADAIVRVHARRVREKLSEYYQEIGRDDAIEISLPKGGYVPEIAKRLPTPIDVAQWDEIDVPIPPPPTSQGTRVHWHWLILVACVSVGLTVATVLAHRFETAPASHSPIPPMPFTSFLGQETTPTW